MQCVWAVLQAPTLTTLTLNLRNAIHVPSSAEAAMKPVASPASMAISSTISRTTNLVKSVKWKVAASAYPLRPAVAAKTDFILTMTQKLARNATHPA